MRILLVRLGKDDHVLAVVLRLFTEGTAARLARDYLAMLSTHLGDPSSPASGMAHR